MKKLIYILLIVSISSVAQQKFITKTGSVNFEASVPSFEEVKAKNNSVTAILNADNGEFAALVLVKAFRFKNALMEEHFNENYAESSQFTKATFKGKIENFNVNELSTSKKTYKINGELTFHGVTRPISDCNILLSKNENTIEFSGNLNVKASDFDIKIPSIVKNKIAEDIHIDFMFELVK